MRFCKFCNKPLKNTEAGVNCVQCESYCMNKCEKAAKAGTSWHKEPCISCEHNPYRKLFRWDGERWVRKDRYKVVRDNQGDTFGMYRKYTLDQWRMQALEWCYMDDNDDTAHYIMTKLPDDKLIAFIAEFWDLEFEKCEQDEEPYDDDFHDAEFLDETPEEYYKARFGEGGTI